MPSLHTALHSAPDRTAKLMMLSNFRDLLAEVKRRETLEDGNFINVEIAEETLRRKRLEEERHQLQKKAASVEGLEDRESKKSRSNTQVVNYVKNDFKNEHRGGGLESYTSSSGVGRPDDLLPHGEERSLAGVEEEKVWDRTVMGREEQGQEARKENNVGVGETDVAAKVKLSDLALARAREILEALEVDDAFEQMERKGNARAQLLRNNDAYGLHDHSNRPRIAIHGPVLQKHNLSDNEEADADGKEQKTEHDEEELFNRFIQSTLQADGVWAEEFLAITTRTYSEEASLRAKAGHGAKNASDVAREGNTNTPSTVTVTIHSEGERPSRLLSNKYSPGKGGNSNAAEAKKPEKVGSTLKTDRSDGVAPSVEKDTVYRRISVAVTKANEASEHLIARNQHEKDQQSVRALGRLRRKNSMATVAERHRESSSDVAQSAREKPKETVSSVSGEGADNFRNGDGQGSLDVGSLNSKNESSRGVVALAVQPLSDLSESSTQQRHQNRHYEGNSAALDFDRWRKQYTTAATNNGRAAYTMLNVVSSLKWMDQLMGGTASSVPTMTAKAGPASGGAGGEAGAQNFSSASGRERPTSYNTRPIVLFGGEVIHAQTRKVDGRLNSKSGFVPMGQSVEGARVVSEEKEKEGQLNTYSIREGSSTEGGKGQPSDSLLAPSTFPPPPSSSSFSSPATTHKDGGAATHNTVAFQHYASLLFQQKHRGMCPHCHLPPLLDAPARDLFAPVIAHQQQKAESAKMPRTYRRRKSVKEGVVQSPSSSPAARRRSTRFSSTQQQHTRDDLRQPSFPSLLLSSAQESPLSSPLFSLSSDSSDSDTSTIAAKSGASEALKTLRREQRYLSKRIALSSQVTGGIIKAINRDRSLYHANVAATHVLEGNLDALLPPEVPRNLLRTLDAAMWSLVGLSLKRKAQGSAPLTSHCMDPRILRKSRELAKERFLEEIHELTALFAEAASTAAAETEPGRVGGSSKNDRGERHGVGQSDDLLIDVAGDAQRRNAFAAASVSFLVPSAESDQSKTILSSGAQTTPSQPKEEPGGAGASQTLVFSSVYPKFDRGVGLKKIFSRIGAVDALLFRIESSVSEMEAAREAQLNSTRWNSPSFGGGKDERAGQKGASTNLWADISAEVAMLTHLFSSLAINRKKRHDAIRGPRNPQGEREKGGGFGRPSSPPSSSSRIGWGSKRRVGDRLNPLCDPTSAANPATAPSLFAAVLGAGQLVPSQLSVVSGRYHPLIRQSAVMSAIFGEVTVSGGGAGVTGRGVVGKDALGGPTSYSTPRICIDDLADALLDQKERGLAVGLIPTALGGDGGSPLASRTPSGFGHQQHRQVFGGRGGGGLLHSHTSADGHASETFDANFLKTFFFQALQRPEWQAVVSNLQNASAQTHSIHETNHAKLLAKREQLNDEVRGLNGEYERLKAAAALSAPESAADHLSELMHLEEALASAEQQLSTVDTKLLETEIRQKGLTREVSRVESLVSQQKQAKARLSRLARWIEGTIERSLSDPSQVSESSATVDVVSGGRMPLEEEVEAVRARSYSTSSSFFAQESGGEKTHAAQKGRGDGSNVSEFVRAGLELINARFKIDFAATATTSSGVEDRELLRGREEQTPTGKKGKQRPAGDNGRKEDGQEKEREGEEIFYLRLDDLISRCINAMPTRAQGSSVTATLDVLVDSFIPSSRSLPAVSSSSLPLGQLSLPPTPQSHNGRSLTTKKTSTDFIALLTADRCEDLMRRTAEDAELSEKLSFLFSGGGGSPLSSSSAFGKQGEKSVGASQQLLSSAKSTSASTLSSNTAAAGGQDRRASVTSMVNSMMMMTTAPNAGYTAQKKGLVLAPEEVETLEEIFGGECLACGMLVGCSRYCPETGAPHFALRKPNNFSSTTASANTTDKLPSASSLTPSLSAVAEERGSAVAVAGAQPLLSITMNEASSSIRKVLGATDERAEEEDEGLGLGTTPSQAVLLGRLPPRFHAHFIPNEWGGECAGDRRSSAEDRSVEGGQEEPTTGAVPVVEEAQQVVKLSPSSKALIDIDELIGIRARQRERLRMERFQQNESRAQTEREAGKKDKNRQKVKTEPLHTADVKKPQPPLTLQSPKGGRPNPSHLHLRKLGVRKKDLFGREGGTQEEINGSNDDNENANVEGTADELAFMKKHLFLQGIHISDEANDEPNQQNNLIVLTSPSEIAEKEFTSSVAPQANSSNENPHRNRREEKDDATKPTTGVLATPSLHAEAPQGEDSPSADKNLMFSPNPRLPLAQRSSSLSHEKRTGAKRGVSISEAVRSEEPSAMRRNDTNMNYSESGINAGNVTTDPNSQLKYAAHNSSKGKSNSQMGISAQPLSLSRHHQMIFEAVEERLRQREARRTALRSALFTEAHSLAAIERNLAEREKRKYEKGAAQGRREEETGHTTYASPTAIIPENFSRLRGDQSIHNLLLVFTQELSGLMRDPTKSGVPSGYTRIAERYSRTIRLYSSSKKNTKALFESCIAAGEVSLAAVATGGTIYVPHFIHIGSDSHISSSSTSGANAQKKIYRGLYHPHPTHRLYEGLLVEALSEEAGHVFRDLKTYYGQMAAVETLQRQRARERIRKGGGRGGEDSSYTSPTRRGTATNDDTIGYSRSSHLSLPLLGMRTPQSKRRASSSSPVSAASPKSGLFSSSHASPSGGEGIFSWGNSEGTGFNSVYAVANRHLALRRQTVTQPTNNGVGTGLTLSPPPARHGWESDVASPLHAGATNSVTSPAAEEEDRNDATIGANLAATTTTSTTHSQRYMYMLTDREHLRTFNALQAQVRLEKDIRRLGEVLDMARHPVKALLSKAMSLEKQHEALTERLQHNVSLLEKEALAMAMSLGLDFNTAHSAANRAAPMGISDGTDDECNHSSLVLRRKSSWAASVGSRGRADGIAARTSLNDSVAFPASYSNSNTIGNSQTLNGNAIAAAFMAHSITNNNDSYTNERVRAPTTHHHHGEEPSSMTKRTSSTVSSTSNAVGLGLGAPRRSVSWTTSGLRYDDAEVNVKATMNSVESDESGSPPHESEGILRRGNSNHTVASSSTATNTPPPPPLHFHAQPSPRRPQDALTTLPFRRTSSGKIVLPLSSSVTAPTEATLRRINSAALARRHSVAVSSVVSSASPAVALALLRGGGQMTLGDAEGGAEEALTSLVKEWRGLVKEDKEKEKEGRRSSESQHEPPTSSRVNNAPRARSIVTIANGASEDREQPKNNTTPPPLMAVSAEAFKNRSKSGHSQQLNSTSLAESETSHGDSSKRNTIKSGDSVLSSPPPRAGGNNKKPIASLLAVIATIRMRQRLLKGVSSPPLPSKGESNAQNNKNNRNNTTDTNNNHNNSQSRSHRSNIASSRPPSSSSTPSTSANNLLSMTESRFALPSTSVRPRDASSLSTPSSARALATVSDNDNNYNPSQRSGVGPFPPLPNVTNAVSFTPKTTNAGSSFSTPNKSEPMFPPITNIRTMVTQEGQQSSSCSHALPFRSADASHSRWATDHDEDETRRSDNSGNTLVPTMDRPHRAPTTNLISSVKSPPPPPPPPISFVPTLPSMPSAVVSRISATTTGNSIHQATPRGRGRGGAGVRSPLHIHSMGSNTSSPRKTNLLNSPSHASTNAVAGSSRAATTDLAGVGGGGRKGESGAHITNALVFSSDSLSSSPTSSSSVLIMTSFKGKTPLRKL